MSEARYPSKERIERDGVLVYAEGDDLINDPDEAKRQGYKLEDARNVAVTERIERDGVLVAAEGDVISADEAKELGVKGESADKPDTADKARRAAKKSK